MNKIIESLKWENIQSAKSNSYISFANSINELQLTLNIYDNFYQIIDNSQLAGETTFGIDIPEEYFRFPHLNNGLSANPISKNERKEVRDVIDIAKKKQRIINDENVIVEHLAKFEMLITFQILEGFIEEILVEQDIVNGLEEIQSIINRNKEVRSKKLSELIIQILTEKAPESYKNLKNNHQFFEEFLHYSNEVRNLHTHKGGIATNHFIKRCLSYGMNDLITKESFENEENVYYIGCISGGYYVKAEQYVSTKTLAAYLRTYSKLIASILDSSFEKTTIINNK